MRFGWHLLDGTYSENNKPVGRRTAPGFHCATRQARRELLEAYGWFYAAYREAAEKLTLGNLTVTFPEGSFPPPRSFVGLALEPWPG